jgi:D-3-phosphoglycerate dehydrogenase
MKILHLESDAYAESDLESLRTFAEVHMIRAEDQAALQNILSNNSFDAIFTRLGVFLGKDEFALQPSLKAVISPTTGLNHIDLNAAEKSGIKVFSLKGEVDFLNNIKSTAEHTWALLLAICRKLVPAIVSVNEGNWERIPFLANELDRKTIGIIGFGRLGKIVAKYAEAFGMHVLINDTQEDAFKGTMYSNSSKSTLLNKADYVLLMAAFSPENDSMINMDAIDSMKDGAIFINTARGELVDEAALLKNLESGKLKAAALDVLRDDSAWAIKSPENHPLITFASENPNRLIISPHMGGYGKDSIERTRTFVTQKFLNAFFKEQKTNSYYEGFNDCRMLPKP